MVEWSHGVSHSLSRLVWPCVHEILDPSNTRCPDFVPGCSGTCARQCETDTADSASSDDEPDPAPRCEECADNPDERLFSRVLKFLPHFWACIVTGMLLGLDPMDRELLDDDVQLMFGVEDCIEVKREHSARTIQVRWRRLQVRRSGACPSPAEQGGAQKGTPADETAESAEQPADDSAESYDPSRNDAKRAVAAPLLIAARVAAILDARRRQRLAAGPPAIQWLAASAIGIILLALVAGTLAGPASVPTHAIDGPFTVGDPGGDAALRSDALSSVAHRISEGLIARA